jgi:3-hydroxyisobutyrate dehydrogenase
MTSVPRATHVEDVFLNQSSGLLSIPPQLGRRILFIELSTIDATVSSQIAGKVVTEGYGDFVDAPCSVCDRHSV